ncbi:EFCB3 protein, partial [Pterocles burchelli]|nr:EFCB3 protein [Pterocles burchelli]
PAHLTPVLSLPAAFSDIFNSLSQDAGSYVNLHSLEETAKWLGVSLTGQKVYDELECAEADGERMLDFLNFLDIITDQKHFAQTTPPGKNDSGSFDSVDDRGILLFKVFSKLVELAALPRGTLSQIISYYKKKLRDCTGQQAWMDGDLSLKCHRKKPHKIQKELAYPMPSFVTSACVAAMDSSEAAAHTEGLKLSDPGSRFPLPRSGSPYAQAPTFPRISKQDATMVVKSKKDLQEAARQRSEPSASFESYLFCERSPVQEAAGLKPPAHCRQPGRSPDVHAKRLNTRHQTGDRPGQTRAQKAPAAQQPRSSPALRQRRSLLELWWKIRRAQLGRQMGNKYFHHTFCIYSWSWSACRELVTMDDLRRLDRQLGRRRRLRQGTGVRPRPGLG